MQEDAKRLVQRCKPCQEHANILHLPATLKQPIDSPIPFAQWGVDLVGPFQPAIGGRKFLIVALDQTKVTNRTILQLLKTRIGSAKGKWVEELPNALWAYRTTPRTATRESPFNLAIGTEAVAPVEIGEPSWRVINYSPEANEEAMRVNLDLVDELREIASIRQQMYKSRMAKAYNSKVRLRSFHIGDLVLRKAEASRPISKLDPKWEGHIKSHKWLTV
ncbi:PREDICTED: uncharacterized protein LOC105953519 [Erythranthe guttata]|uniref:uncharacterized protein LOC105953519 n=1 Tax=Erythranthe guttata TaxID=4155 RepID=UPI00064DA824|nr:PREDICTED: uncharacterized protein LOC105953519 [Erythranthe guttata]|eukprot:XP_012832643.1 PREDICTED: uncharacterized protein LOC105953519 [Erythranthe guttata]